MTDTNEQKWREEFESGVDVDFKILLKRDLDERGTYVHPKIEWRWKGYLDARKKAHSENEDAFKAFTLDLADRYEKEIEKLKEEIDFKDSQLKTREAVLNKEIERLHKKVTSLHGGYDEAVIIFNGECEKRDKLLEQAKPYVEILFHEAVSKDFFLDLPNYEQWLKDYEELKNEQ